MGSSISVPQFNESFEADLKGYMDYIRKLGRCINAMNKSMKTVSNELYECIQIDKAWYDDTAVKFSKWWNNTAVDGGRKACMTIYEEISNIYGVTGTIISKALAYENSSTKDRISKGGYGDIIQVANGEKLEHTELKWEDLKAIEVNEEDSNVNIDAAKINRRLDAVKLEFDKITDEMERIRHLVAYYLTDRGTAKKAIDFKDDFDYASILRMQRNVGDCLAIIQKSLSDHLETHKDEMKRGKDDLKNLFNATYAK